MIRARIALFGGALLLAACSSTPDESVTGTTGASSTPDGGLGTESSLGAPTDLGGSAAGGGVMGAGAAHGAGAPGSQQDLEVNVGDRVFFAYDSSSLDGKARTTLDRQATWFKQFPGVTATVEGYADPQGTNEYNLALGERRASAAKSYLTTQGVAADRLGVVSYGEERRASAGESEQDYAQDRRAVTVVNTTN